MNECRHYEIVQWCLLTYSRVTFSGCCYPEWTAGHEHQHLLGTCQRYRLSGPSRPNETQSAVHQASWGPTSTWGFEEHWSKVWVGISSPWQVVEGMGKACQAHKWALGGGACHLETVETGQCGWSKTRWGWWDEQGGPQSGACHGLEPL